MTFSLLRYIFARILAIPFLLLISCVSNQDNSDLYDRPGYIPKEPPYFEKGIPQSGGNAGAQKNNPYAIKRQQPYDEDAYYVPPANYNHNLNEGNDDVPRSGWDRMY
jgi:hypothetical protein